MNFDTPDGVTPLDPNEIDGLRLSHILKQPRFTWGSGNLVDAGKCRKQYITALRAADQNDFVPLLAFVRS